MIIGGKGEAAPGLFVLGVAGTPSYLLDAPRPVLFDAGFACLGPAYVRDAKAILGDRQPALLCLTHVHFDHCGAAAHLKQAFPGLQIAASAQAKGILERPNALALMARLNQGAAQAVRSWDESLASQVEFAPFGLDLVLEDGQEIDLGGGLTLKVLATPGHTRDFLSYHIPQRGILVCSEAGGCDDGTGYVMTEFIADYEAYMAGLQRLTGLDARVICQGHRLVYTDDDAPRFLERSFQAAREWVAWVEGLLKEHAGDQAQVTRLVKAHEYDPRPQPKQPEPAYLLNLEARVRHLAGRLGLAPA